MKTSKNVGDILNAWIGGTALKGKRREAVNGCLYADGRLVARKHPHGCVLINIETWEDGRPFNPHVISQQIGLPVEDIIAFRKAHLESSGAEERTGIWNTTNDTDMAIRKCDVVGLSHMRVIDAMKEPTNDDVREYGNAIRVTLKKALKCRESHSISTHAGKKVQRSDENGWEGNWSATNLEIEGTMLCTRFHLDKSLLNNDELFAQAKRHYERSLLMRQAGGSTEMKKILQELALPDSVPPEEVIKLMAMPEFMRTTADYSNGYKTEWITEPLVRQMASAPLREKYGVRGERRKK